MKINYPIKYTAMPIVNDVTYYIVSRCYLLSDSTRYSEDGQSIKEYEVFFPYQFYDSNKFKYVTPEYNYIDGYCTNSKKVEAVFNSYDEALKYATELNEKSIKKSYQFLSFSKNFYKQVEKIKDDIYSKLEEYKLLENQILYNTNNLENKKEKKLDKVIWTNNKEIKLLPLDLYKAISIFDYKKFIVYTITQEQYNKLIELINNCSVSLDIKKIIGQPRGLLIYNSNDYIKRIVNQNIDGVYYLDELQTLHYSDKLSKVTQDEILKTDKNINVIYTTETFEDVINSYKKYEEIDVSKIQGPVLKRKY